MTDFLKARENMVDGQIHPMGILYPGVLDSFANIPRERFVPEFQQGIAYTDQDLDFGKGRYLIDPITHARMVQALEPKSSEVALDIGGLTGYSAAILSSLVSTVIAVEDDEALTAQATATWQDLGIYNASAVAGELAQGYKDCSAYDLIFVGGAVSDIPETLSQQLSEGGRMVLILKKPDQVMGQVVLVKSLGDKGISSYTLFEAGGHYLPGFAPEPAFQF